MAPCHDSDVYVVTTSYGRGKGMRSVIFRNVLNKDAVRFMGIKLSERVPYSFSRLTSWKKDFSSQKILIKVRVDTRSNIFLVTPVKQQRYRSVTKTLILPALYSTF